MSKSVRDSFDKKTIPEDLKAAMKGRAKLYSSAVGEASDIVNLAAEAPFVGGLALESPDLDLVAEAPNVGPPPAKRSRGSVSRPRVVATSSSSSSQVEPDAGGGRSVLSRPRSGRGEVAFPVRRWANRHWNSGFRGPHSSAVNSQNAPTEPDAKSARSDCESLVHCWCAGRSTDSAPLSTHESMRFYVPGVVL